VKEGKKNKFKGTAFMRLILDTTSYSEDPPKYVPFMVEK
jgi:hypothetical protein